MTTEESKSAVERTKRHMGAPIVSLTDTQLDELAERLALRLTGHNCLCNLAKEARPEVSHLMGMLKDQGGGNHSAGIEHLRKTIEANKEQRRVGRIILGVFVTGTAVGFFGWIGAVVWGAFKTAVVKP